MLPLRAASRFWGWVHSIDLPHPIRKPLLNLYITRYGCNLEEAVVDDINSYRSLGEFFSRQLKKEVRPIHPGDCLVNIVFLFIFTFNCTLKILIMPILSVHVYTKCNF